MFYYTNADSNINSSAVSAAYYNANDRRLAVVLSSGYGYVYSDVPESVFDTLVNPGFGRSTGRYYAKTVKRDYGPGEALGYSYDDDFAHISESEPVLVGTGAVGTPKGLTYSENAVVTTNVVSNFIDAGYTDLSLKPIEGTKRAHKVFFTIDGQWQIREYNVEAGSVDEAVKALTESTEALGLVATVKEVCVYFE